MMDRHPVSTKAWADPTEDPRAVVSWGEGVAPSLSLGTDVAAFKEKESIILGIVAVFSRGQFLEKADSLEHS